MKDGWGRTIDYMRISITDRCNLRCRYCMPDGIQSLPRREILTLEEMEAVDRVSSIQLSDTQVKLHYLERFEVKMPLNADFSYKLRVLEQAVAKAEERQYELTLKAEEVASNYLELQKVYDEQKALEEEIAALYTKWETLAAELEEARG